MCIFARSAPLAAIALLCVLASAAHGQAAPAADPPPAVAPTVVPPSVDPKPPQLPPPSEAGSAAGALPKRVAYASSTPATPASAASALPGNPTNEPNVKRNVVEDDNARIDELNVRGAVRSISVTPKGPIKTPYEVVPTDASHDPSDGPGSMKGAQGRRVWRVLNF